jgi:hypothetical protein
MPVRTRSLEWNAGMTQTVRARRLDLYKKAFSRHPSTTAGASACPEPNGTPAFRW